MWSKGIITPIPKCSTADTRDPLSYRGITLAPCSYKLFCSILNNRLVSWLETKNILHDEQNGFRGGRSTIDHLSTLTSIIETRKLRKLSTFAVFVDFKKAYDTVNRNLLFNDLNDLGISKHFLCVIKAIYSQVECAIKLNGHMTEWFSVNSGLKQGCVLSPILFNIFINSLVTNIKALDIGIDIDGEKWKWHRAIYWTIRLIMAAYALGAIMTVYVMSVGEKHLVLVYLTIWTFTLLTIHLWIATVITIFYRPTMNKSGDKMQGVTNPDFLPSSVESTLSQTADLNRSNIGEDQRCIPWFLKLSWLLGDVVLSFEIVVSIIYFVFLFPDKENRGALINDMNMHAMNTVFVLIDFCISARPVYLLHVIYPIIYGTIYAIFSVIYWTQDHVNNVLYSVLDWNSPGRMQHEIPKAGYAIGSHSVKVRLSTSKHSTSANTLPSCELTPPRMYIFEPVKYKIANYHSIKYMYVK
ncbi:unnamed protein product [Mytilus edulis]|uniref:Reverse transcriptase domain-containing protein n=1 Tax=Mytilus edulis TaxID=6550 RepID=A0A8S3S9L7_MYTED|nr:unnamed protein product [Mytilus edulis]